MNTNLKEAIQPYNLNVKVEDEFIKMEKNFTHESGIYDQIEVKKEHSWDTPSEIENIHESRRDDSTVDEKPSLSTEENHQRRLDKEDNYECDMKDTSSFGILAKRDEILDSYVERKDVISKLTECKNRLSDNITPEQTHRKKSHKCHICDYATGHKATLKNHIDAIHLNVKKHKCHLCDYATTQKINLRSHIDVIHLNLKNHKCHLCDYATNQKQTLKSHIDTVHLNFKNQKCNFCDYATNRKGSLNDHIDAIHSNLRNHKCHLCEFATNKRNNLKIHIDAVHSNLRNHKCHLCDYATNRKDHLKRHVNTIHSN